MLLDRPQTPTDTFEESTGRLRIYPKETHFDVPQFPERLPFKLNGLIKAVEFEEAVGRINSVLRVTPVHACYLTFACLCLPLGGCLYCYHHIAQKRKEVNRLIADINRNFEIYGVSFAHVHLPAKPGDSEASQWLEVDYLPAAARSRISTRGSVSLNEEQFLSKGEQKENVVIERKEVKRKSKEKKAPELTAAELFATDPQLRPVDRKWSSLASEASVQRTAKALQDNKCKVDVVNNKEDALNILKSIHLKESSIYLCGSTTLEEVGWTKYLKEHKDHAKRNIKHESVAAGNKGDRETANELMREGMRADYVFTSVPAISEKGDMVICCMTGTRTGAFSQTAKTLVVVAGTNKIVDSYETCLKRMNDYALPLESARVRIVFKNYGVSSSAINFSGAIRATHASDLTLNFSKPNVHVILVKQQLGY